MTREEAIKSLRSDNEVMKMLNTFPVLSKLIDKVLESPWRSVKEELPKIGQYVFYCTYDDNITPFGYGVRDKDEDGEYWRGSDPENLETPIAEPDYWMPIPEIPEEKEDAI